ncbi:unnamed protein product [Cercopithifilaria johnstoni]|uniref:Uncharacterized protein n=1 Tax=Cercopithifilaria johnstoni TaxID=2874296 RepID=A0A8J2M8M7_9BILA|nr:unnamed protein product [Cercopithifilaria johnstoni]
MFSISSVFCKIAFVVNFMVVNDTMILAVSENMLSVWEYEDFVLERYKQHLIEPMKNLLSTDSDLDQTLKNVVIETNDTIDGFTKYRSIIKGVKDRKF